MKIFFILPSLAGGGAERVLLTLANGFSKKSNNVYLLLIDNQGVYKDEVLENIQIINLESNRVLSSFFSIRQWIIEIEPDIIFSSIAHLNLLLLFIKKTIKKSKSKFIIRESNTLSKVNKKSIKIAIIKTLVKKFYPVSDLIIVPSKGVAKDLINNFNIKNKIEFMNNPIDYNWLKSQSKKPLEDPFLLQSSKNFIVGVGSLTKQKDFSTLIKAFLAVKKKKDFKLIILGEGPERSSLEQLIIRLGLENDVSMPGFVKNPFNYLKASSLFVLSSLFEGSPNVLIQALLLNIPCVSTNCQSGPREILRDGKYGQLVEVGDHLEMSEAIINVLEKKREISSLKRIRKEYDSDKIVDKYLQLPIFRNNIL